MFDAPTMRILPSARLCRVHLFRHGEVEGGGGRVCRGHADVPLSARGVAQSEAAARWFRAQGGEPVRVFSSDLSRCRGLADRLGAEVIALPALREQHMGAWDGRTWESLTVDDPAGVSAYWDDYVSARPPGGESYAELYARVTGWWDAAALDGRVVLVTHIGVIRALVCHWFGLGPGQALRWAPGYATHSRLLLAEAGPVLETFGEQVAADAPAPTPPRRW